MSQLSQLLSLRLSYARFKVEKGWSKSTIDEIESLSASQQQSLVQQSVTSSKPTTAPATTGEIPTPTSLPSERVCGQRATKSIASLPTQVYHQGQASSIPSASSSGTSFSGPSDGRYMPHSSASSYSNNSFSSSLSSGTLYSSASSSDMGIPPSTSYAPPVFQYTSSLGGHQVGGIPNAQTSVLARYHSQHRMVEAGYRPAAHSMVNSQSEPGIAHQPVAYLDNAVTQKSSNPQQGYWPTESYDWGHQRQLAPSDFAQPSPYATNSPSIFSSNSNHDSHTPQMSLSRHSSSLHHSIYPQQPHHASTAYNMTPQSFGYPGYQEYPTTGGTGYGSPAPGAYPPPPAAPTPDQNMWTFMSEGGHSPDADESGMTLLPPANIQ